MLWILVALVGVAIVVFGVVRLAEASSHGQSGTNALALAILGVAVIVVPVAVLVKSPPPELAALVGRDKPGVPTAVPTATAAAPTASRTATPAMPTATRSAVPSTVPSPSTPVAPTATSAPPKPAPSSTATPLPPVAKPTSPPPSPTRVPPTPTRPTETVSPRAAIDTVGTFLNHLKERRLAQAQGLATPEFVNGEGARLLDEVLSRGFREFEVLGTEDADGAVKAIVREYWRDGIQMAAYTVVPTAARPLVAARETIN